MKHALSLQKISYSYDNKQLFNNLSLNIQEGEFVSLIGPSGCGKTTLMNLICGFLPYQGIIYLEDSLQENYEKSLAYMTQKDTLLPFLTVKENLELPFKLKNLNLKLYEDKIEAFLQSLNLSESKNKRPHELSVGMKHKVLLIRTFLTPHSDIFLFDEPFGSLDAISRMQAQEQLMDILKEESKKTVLFITHDIDEAIFLSDTIYVLKGEPISLEGPFKTENFKHSRNNTHLPLYGDFKNHILHLLRA